MLIEEGKLDNSQAGRQATIIVPVYNTGKYKLTKCIKSITAQTYTDFLLVLVDDGSTDDSGRVCDMLVKNDSRIKVIHQVNKGSVEARRRAFSRMKRKRQNTSVFAIRMILCPRMRLKS